MNSALATAASVSPAGAEPTPAPASRVVHWRQLLVAILEIGLVVVLVDRFQIESRAFAQLATLAGGGFVVHALLPRAVRLPFFVLLSLCGLVLVLGARASIWIVLLGSALIGLCHLPISFRGRAALLLLGGAILAVLRLDWLHAPWAGAVWPILGSMFMFRLLIYLYDLRHGERPDSPWQTLAYFFALPNVCFALFPVVDYKTFRRTYDAGLPAHCYQTGIRWMTRGLLHLLLYRLVYYYAALDPAEVASFGDFAQHATANFALYLRVSGVFHLVVGMLRLFGFGLPETHLLYFLSSSINDFWRRINIYWKDFMLKLFYLPAYFRLRRHGPTTALVLSTLGVVLVTWALHSYQWFWLRGTFPIKWQDGVFWGALGLLMIFNSLYETRHPRARGRRARVWTPRNLVSQAAGIVFTFTFICVLWSLWTSESLAEWLAMWSFLGAENGSTAARSAGGGWLLAVVAVAVAHPGAGRPEPRVAASKGRALDRSAASTLAALLSLWLLSVPAVYGRLGAKASEAISSLRVARLNRLDAERLQRGYYEDLLNVERFNSELWYAYRAKPSWWVELEETALVRELPDALERELRPRAVAAYKGARLEVNRWGMRDRDYQLAKPPGTLRLGVVGASYTMGAGVANEETFEAVLEERLNADALGDRHWELLNFAVGGYSPLQRLLALERKALPFDLDAVFYVAHENETDRLVHQLASVLADRSSLPEPHLDEIVRQLGLRPETARFVAISRLEGRSEELLAWVYRRFVATCRARGIEPVWIFLPTLEFYGQRGEVEGLRRLAAAADFETIDLSGLWEGQDPAAIRIAEWDYHPNAKGHRSIAERLVAELRARPELFALGPRPAESAAAGAPDPTMGRER
ncbi:MAG: hypothetical protein ACRD0X_03015 [Thermoanaerobaculia bacterium]